MHLKNNNNINIVWLKGSFTEISLDLCETASGLYAWGTKVLEQKCCFPVLVVFDASLSLSIQFPEQTGDTTMKARKQKEDKE